MRIYTVFLFLLVSLSAFSQGNNPLVLKFNSDLYYTRTPGNNNRGIRMTVKDKLSSVQVITSDNNSDRRLNSGESFLNGKGRQAFVLVIPKLYGIKDLNSGRSYLFGEKSGENNSDDAVVMVAFSNQSATPQSQLVQQPVKLKIDTSEVFMVSASSAPAGGINGKNFLKIEASTSQTATIAIDREPNRGNVIVGIFSVKTGNLIGTLNPKDPVNQSPRLSFTVNEPVFVIPIIRPVSTRSNGVDTVRFDVGDPLQNATVETVEE
jgi:hypothetical protein